MIIYIAEYNPMIHESGYVTLSLHQTYEGAKKAINQHKEKIKKEWNETYKDDEEPFSFDQFKDWSITEKTVFD